MSKKVAVYGSLRKGMGNHGLLAQSKLLSTEALQIPYFMISLGGFPGLVPDDKEKHTIVVEVYEVDETTLRRLDGLEGYRGPDKDNFYDRVEVETSHGPTYIYTLHRDYGCRETDSLVTHGDWVQYRRAG